MIDTSVLVAGPIPDHEFHVIARHQAARAHGIAGLTVDLLL